MPHVSQSGPYDPEQVFTFGEVAELLQVTERRVKRWVYHGKLGYTLLPGGRGRRIKGAHLNAALAAGDHKPEAE
jgi:excisionase family DNA binding protein